MCIIPVSSSENTVSLLNDHFNPIHDSKDTEDTSSFKTLVGENKKKTTKMLPLSVSKARLNVGPFQIIRVRHVVT